MSVNPDFADLFRTFNDADVRYLVVGAYAVIFHAEPRYTKNVDLWVEPTPGNAERVFRALAAFGAPLDQVRAEDFQEAELVYQIGIEPNRIDILMGIPGLDFAAAWEHAVASRYGDQPIRVLSLDDLILAKRTSGRPQDLLDVARLERIRGGS